MKKKTNEEFLKDVKRIKGNLYTPLEEYIKSSVNMTVRHNICGNEFQITPNRLLRSKESGCPHCFGNKAKQKTNEQFLLEVKELTGDEFTFLETYINRAHPISVRHNKCGREFKVSPGNFLCGMRCKKCSDDSKRSTKEIVQNKIQEIVGKDFIIVGEYHSMQTKVDVLHTTCGNVNKTRPTDMIYKGVSCKYCSMSNGEKLTKSVLDELGVTYEIQKSFPKLKNINNLTYDFYIPNLKIVIEYQGEQHFRPKNFGGSTKEYAEEVYNLQVINDNIKRKFATDNGLILIEIPYTCNTLTKVRQVIKESIQ